MNHLGKLWKSGGLQWELWPDRAVVTGADAWVELQKTKDGWIGRTNFAPRFQPITAMWGRDAREAIAECERRFGASALCETGALAVSDEDLVRALKAARTSSNRWCAAALFSVAVAALNGILLYFL